MFEATKDLRDKAFAIKRLREKIKDTNHWSLATVWGIGYKFELKES